MYAGGIGEINLTSEGLAWSKELSNAYAMLRQDAAQHERGLRLPHRGADVFFHDLDQTKAAISQYLAGIPAREINLFARTPLAEMRPDEGRNLVSYIWALTTISYAVMLTSEMNHGHREGVVLIPHPMIVSLPEDDSSMPPLVEDLLFWKTGWYDLLREEDLTNAIVERPILRCDSSGFYATSFIFVLDALAWAIEAAFFRYPRMPGLYLSEGSFQRAFAEELERQAVDICRELGLQAGHVTENGVWRCQGIDIDLAKQRKDDCPGQIDCLAMTADRRIAFVFECKVLRLPNRINTLRNILSKLNFEDEEGFHAGLHQKSEWVAATPCLRSVHSALVVDRGVPLLQGAPHPVISVFDLRKYLTSTFGDT